MAIDVAGKRIVVTGGARGMGGAAVIALARAGASVASLDILDEAGRHTIEAAGIGKSARYSHCDVTDKAAVNAAFDTAAMQMGGLDGVLHSAGAELGALAEDIDEAHWDTMLNLNAKGTMYVNQAAFRHLRAHGGAIANMASSAGVLGMPTAAAYSASKGAVLGWTRTVAQEWGRYGIRVNALTPCIWTPMYDHLRSRMTPAQLAEHDSYMAARIPLGGKLGDPDKDMAPAIVFLMSDASRFITGQTLSVDGGLMMTR